MAFLFDDAGSWPLPEGFDAMKVPELAYGREPSYVRLVQESMQQKIEAGIEIPTYPQCQHMCEQFLYLLRKEELCDGDPYKIKESDARIIELEFLEDVSRMHYERSGQRLLLRICITGALELYIYEFGRNVDEELLFLLSESMNAFLKNAQRDTKYMMTQVVSIDDPSLGLLPDLNVEEEAIIKAWEKTAQGMKCDVQIHLHSPLGAAMACHTRGIDIVSAEIASHPDYLDIIDKGLLSDNDKFLRAGITRTDFDRLASEYSENHGIDVFQDRDCFSLVAGSQTPHEIKKRLEKAYEKFGDLILYAGPDCALRGFGTGKAASILMKNTKIAIQDFRREHNEE